MSNGLSGHNKTQLAMVAIGGIVVLESIALLMGHNGLLLTSMVGAIGIIAGGLLGFSVGVGE